MFRLSDRPLLQVTIAFIAVTTSFALSISLGPFAHFYERLFLFLAAVVVSAWFGGLPGGISATVLTLLVVVVVTPAPIDSSETWSLACFLVLAIFVSWLENARRRTVTLLQQSHRQLEAILQNVAAGVTVQDRSGQVLLANDAAARILFGRSTANLFTQMQPTEIMNQFEIMDESGQPFPANQLPGRKVLAGETAAEAILCFRSAATRENRWSIVKARALLDKHGSPEFAVNIFEDITRLKQTEQALRNQHEWLYTTLSSIGDGVIATDTNSRLTFMNQTAQRLTGCNERESLGRPLAEVFRIVDEQTRTVAENPAQRALEAGEIVNLANHTLLIASDGTERYIADSAAPIRNADNQITGAVLVFRDISKQRQIENSLRESEERFRLMADYAPVLIWISDVDGQYTFFNRPWLQFTGRTLEQELGNGWTQGVHPEDYERRIHTYLSASQERKDFQIEYRLRRANGDYRWVLDSGIPCFDGQSQFNGYIGSCLDITTLKIGEQRLRFLDTASRVLAASLDYRTTLTKLAQIALPTLADWCVINLIKEDQSIQAVAAAHLDPDKTPAVWDWIRRFPADLAADYGTGKVIRTGEPELLADFYDMLPEKTQQNMVYREFVEQLGCKAYMIVPLIVDDHILGAISFARGGNYHPYGADDLAFAQELARRIALAVSHASLYQQTEAALFEAETARQTVTTILESITDGFIALDKDWRYIYINSTAEKLFEKPKETLIGKVMWDIFPPDAPNADTLFFTQTRRAMLERVTVEYEHFSERFHIWLDIHIYPSNDGGIAIYIKDITERKQYEERLRFLSQASEAFSSSLEYKPILKHVAQLSVPTMADWCVVDIMDEQGALHRLAITHANPAKQPVADRLQQLYPIITPDSNHTLLRVLHTGKPWLDPRVSKTRFVAEARSGEHLQILQDLGFESEMVLPLAVHGKLLGGITFVYGESNRHYTQTDLEFAQEIAHKAALAIDNARLYEAERDAHLRQTFLVEASTFLYSSLDYHQTLQRVTNLALPHIADWCAIEMLAKDGKLYQSAVSHIDPEKVALLREWRQRYPPDPAETLLSDSILIPQITDTLLEAVAQDADHLAILRSLSLNSSMSVPIIIRDQVVGRIGFVTDESGRRYGAADLEFAEELAHRIALAIENIQLYFETHEQRERLQVTLASIGDAVIATDMQGKVTFMNPIAQRLTGWEQGEAVGSSLDRVFHIINETTRLPAESPVSKVLRTNEIVELSNHTVLITQDNREIPIDDSAAPIRDDDGNLIGVILVFRDITEQRRTQAAEHQQRILAEALHDTAIALTGSLDLDQVLQRIMENIGRVVAHDAADIMFIENGIAHIAASRGYVENNLTALEAAKHELRFPIAQFPNLQQMADSKHALSIPDTYTDERWIDLPETRAIRSYLGVPIQVQGEVIGFLNLISLTPNFFDQLHSESLQAFANQAGIAIQNARLHQQAKELAILEERQRLARDLHDAVSQALFSANVIAEALPRLFRNKPDLALEQLDHLAQLTRSSMAEMRTLLVELRPATLLNTPFPDLLRQLAEAVKGRKQLSVRVNLADDVDDLPPDMHIALYRITQEALNNIVKHAKATQVSISFRCKSEYVELTIGDNGRGFESDNTSSGLGLHTMAERANSIGASLTVTSTPGQGTQIAVIRTGELENSDTAIEPVPT